MQERPRDSDDRGERLDLATGELSAWLISLIVHFLFLLVISLLTTGAVRHLPALTLTLLPPETAPVDVVIPQTFQADPLPRETIGSAAWGGLDDPLEGRTELTEDFSVPPIDLEPQRRGQIEVRELVAAATGPEAELNRAVKGAAGVGVTGADGAIDRITQEIRASLDERPTLVVWFFDQSGSLQTQREQVWRRFDRVYEELGVIRKSGDRAFTRHRDAPLLTAVVAFGADVQFLVDEPTDQLPQIRRAVRSITQDDSGVERVFSAIFSAARRYRKYRKTLDRNVMFVAFTDEAGDDQDGLDQTVDFCRRMAIPVYVVGVPAPFGRPETLVKWIDPDPRYDQSVQWGRVSQGPESLLPERIRIAFNGFREDESPIDSGFGPFALTRLCFETGGIYFTVHPNRQTGRTVRRGETAAYSAYFSAFFDPLVMRRYRPEYVSAAEYRRQVEASRLRSALIQAAQLSWLYPLESPRRRFLVRNDAQLAEDLTEAQKDAARLQLPLDQLSQLLRNGEDDRPREIVPRWQAGYDLAMGRVLATKVRVEGYNEMLARAKRGMVFEKATNNTWQLENSDRVSTSSRLQREADQAREYLQRVVHDHPGTPWALLARRELSQPLGWEWTEHFTPIDPPPDRVAVNDNPDRPPPRDDQPRVIQPPPERRPPPRL